MIYLFIGYIQSQLQIQQDYMAPYNRLVYNQMFSAQDGQIRFLIATDVHLGHKQNHTIRHNDSFEAFEQVMQHAQSRHVDFVLLGGDLFDEVNPSTDSIFRCMNILKKNIFGPKQVKISVSLNGQQYKTNFKNQDINISLPVFTIHGNHDYPANDFGKPSVLDLLQASDYVNYFGKHLNLHHITIKPLIITKTGCKTKIALYGLGYIKDQILRDLFQQKNFVFQLPVGGLKDYVTILVIHQNRFKKNFRPGVPESKSFDPRNIPEWINLTIWGHQHESIYNVQSQFDRNIFQPGSTVLTSFIQAEALKKQCGLITVKDNIYIIESLLLNKSYRPMVCQNYQYQILKKKYGQDFDLFTFLDNYIASLLDDLKQAHQSNRKPIIRLKMQYTGLPDILKVKQIQSKYHKSVANCDKIIAFWKRKEEKSKRITDEELFNATKAKKIIKGVQTVTEQIGSLIRIGIEKCFISYFTKDFMINLINQLGQDQSLNANETVKKKYADSQKKISKISEETIIKMNNYKQTEFKKTMKYHMEKIQMLTTGKTPSYSLWGVKTLEQFLNLQGSLMDANKLKMHIKLTQEMVNKKQKDSSIMINESVQDSSRQSKLKQSSLIEKNVIDIDRSDSQDCCQRALKNPRDEWSNNFNFNQAKVKLQQEKNKYKKPALSKQPLNSKDLIRKPTIQIKEETKKPNSQKDPKRQQKNVRFSNDFM